MKLVEALLRRVIGLDSASVGAGAIEQAVRRRLAVLGLDDVPAYLHHIASHEQELEELVEAVVVAETWFFRDEAPFAALTQLVREELAARESARLRILSVPCSTGEEPYSLAMALLDAGVAAKRFIIEGVDISQRALDRARAACYGKNSFRGGNLEFRDRFFTATPQGHELLPVVREQVEFQRGNLVDGRFGATRPPYDFIFCRNVLIYFDRPTQRRTLQRLHRMLAPGGYLFVGSAEFPIVSENGFVPLGLPMAFACRKAQAGRGKRDDSDWGRALARGPARPVIAATLQAVPAPVAPALIPRSLPPTPATTLEQARNLADAGRLAEARELCELHLSREGPSAQAFYLMGLVRDAAGDDAAASFYRKALYLDPHHYECLLQMALTLERKGDVEGAQKLKRRAQRHAPKA